MRLRILCGFLTLVAVIPQNVLASVLAIDYGAEFITASLMKPGLPFDVLLNKDSKRKIHSSVGWKRGDRAFGQDAAQLATRFPTDSFSYVKLLQAAPFDSDAARFYAKISTAELSEAARRTTELVQGDGTKWSPEELIGMQLGYVKHLAETAANEKVKDVIITVPAYYTQFERDAVADAVEIADLRLLALIHDGTATGVNYAMTRNFPTTENHIIYDVGASGTRATIVQFSGFTEKTGAPGTQITVSGIGYNRGVGGVELDRRLRDILADHFNEKFGKGKDVRKDKKAMARLWKEAQRVKHILSANNEVKSQVESVAWDIDFKAQVKRSTFEDACKDLQDKWAQPIKDALKNAGLTLDDINSVILAGGSSRVPMVRKVVEEYVGKEKISLNVNADEAPVLGAALHGAALSRQFKTKNIKISDISVHDIQASYFAAATTSNSRPRSITTTLFPAGSKTGTKKTLTFKRKEDFNIFFDYKDIPAPGFPTRMLEVEILGVAEALGNLTERGAIDPVVKATVSLSESGFVSVTGAVAFGEIKDDSLTGKLKGLFGGSSSTEEEAQSAENTPPRDSTSESASSSSSSSAAPSESATADKDKDAKDKKKEKKKEKPEDTIKLEVKTSFTTIPPMTVEEKKVSRARLKAMDQDEAIKTRREETRNSFESYLYRLRDLVTDDTDETPFKKCSQPDERNKISQVLEESFDWLNDRGDLAETTQFLNKRIALETLEKPIMHRYKEIEAFPQALNNSQRANWSTRLFLAEAKQNLTNEIENDLPSKYSLDELESLEKTLKEHETWLSEYVDKQRKVKSWEDPVIETTEMKARAKVLEQQLQRLWKRKVPKIIRKKPTVSATEEAKAEQTPVAGDDDGKQEPLKDKEDGERTGGAKRHPDEL
ncbi:actin-like ATPase domain-containing protein [Coprinopsis marcescibilis]|uniref:Actin-like ATPase domain-containing protein n=1 Tax=Coprinopsis marcescibilis TaxID=230819 RepID=A0A5C3KWR7_COPMA|nr:actin-like ATPase domain-containing protein [Coprinopsis marcescibilis]